MEKCRAAGVRLVVNQNMRYDHAVRGCGSLLQQGALGDPVLATIEMRAVPHWMPWQERLGWVTLRIMSIHQLDTFRHWFGTPRRVIASVRPDLGVRFRVEGTAGMALGDIGWPEAWFPDAFVGPMAELLRDLEGTAPAVATGDDNLLTIAVVDAAYRSAREHRGVEVTEITTTPHHRPQEPLA